MKKGEKKLDEETAPVIYPLRLRPDIYQRYREIARLEDRPISRVLRGALNDWINGQTNAQLK